MSEPGDKQPILSVRFYSASPSSEPVRDWLLQLTRDDRRAVGSDIKTAQYGWPLGMPLIRKLEPGSWEVRSRIADGIARVLFTVGGQVMVLLHGFVKRSQKTPLTDLRTARQRLSALRKE
ncbi:MAG: type II toxin-antitoxin system RelE/ParE family toxin [Coriobacteriia bacterium]